MYTGLLYLTGAEDLELTGAETGIIDRFDDPEFGATPAKGVVIEPSKGRLLLFTAGVENFHCGLPAVTGSRWFFQQMFDCDECAAHTDGWNLIASDGGVAGGSGFILEPGPPCLNGAECVDREKAFLCKCDDGFGGQRCERILSPGEKWNYEESAPVEFRGGRRAGHPGSGHEIPRVVGGSGGVGGGAVGQDISALPTAAELTAAAKHMKKKKKRKKQSARLQKRFPTIDEADILAVLEAEGWHAGKAGSRLAAALAAAEHTSEL